MYTKQTKNKKRLNYLFCCVVLFYLATLAVLVVTRGHVFSALFDTPPLYRSVKRYNLVPFSLSSLTEINQGITGNIIMFIPMGIILSCIVHRVKFLFAVFGSAFLSCLAEYLQYTFSTGALDINDIITNSIGGLIGAVIYSIIYHFYRKNEDRTLRRVAMISTIFPPFLFSYARFLFVDIGQVHFSRIDAIVSMAYFVPVCLFLLLSFWRYIIPYTVTLTCFATFFYTVFIQYI